MFKNVASQKVALFSFDVTTGLPNTGDGANITPYVSKDYGTVTVLGTVTATEMDSTNAKGWYSFVLTQAETNGDMLLFTGKSSTANKVVVGLLIPTDPPSFSGLTLAAIVSAIWQDTTAADFTTALSIGKSILNGVSLGTGLTINGYTGNTPQTGDAFVRLGAPAGASMSADIAAAKADTAAIKVQTDKFVFSVANQVDSNVIDWKGATAPAMTGDAFARLGAPAGASVSADMAAVKTDTAAVKVQTDKFVFSVANQVDSNVIDWKGSAAPAMTGDAFARLGVPAGASVSADNAAIKSDTAAILNDVGVGAGAIFARLGAPSGASMSADIAAVKSDTATVVAALPANLSLLSINGSGKVKIQSGVAKNTALNNFEFVITDSTNHAPVTGVTVTVERSIDNGAFAAGTLSAVTEIASGVYSVNFAAADLNGGVITLLATATGCDATIITIVTDA